jgi:hypothetical protein
MLGLGLTLIVVVLVLPSGLMGLAGSFRRRQAQRGERRA